MLPISSRKSVGQLSDRGEFCVGQSVGHRKTRRMFRIDLCHVQSLLTLNSSGTIASTCLSKVVPALSTNFTLLTCSGSVPITSVILHIRQFSLLAISSTSKTMSSTLTFLFHFPFWSCYQFLNIFCTKTSPEVVE